MNATASIGFLARHELRIAWRDWLGMLTAGRRSRTRTLVVALVSLTVAMHLIALSIVARFADLAPDADRGTLVVVTGCVLLAGSLMMSQAMESVTRAFYARSDLDLVMAAPCAPSRVFAVRLMAMAASTVAMALLIASPFINVLAWRGGAHWLVAYGVVMAVGAMAAALAIALTMTLFRLIGAARTRLVSQVLAAVIGAAFVIGLQIAAILSYGTLSYFSFLQSEAMVAFVPALDSALWGPARAVLGDLAALATTLTVAAMTLGAVITLYAPQFGGHAAAAGAVGAPSRQRHARHRRFRAASARAALRRKEWTLLYRDPWLASQTLMQLLYLVPPALMLWRAFGTHNDDLVLLVPVLVMGAGQLAGGLTWLAISGEDAPDLVASAPVPNGWVVRAKLEAVAVSTAVVFAPFVIAMALASWRSALAACAGIAMAAASAAMIQLSFRVQAKRKHFRRRQTSSRLATFAEAFASIAWAATAGMLAAGMWQTAIVAALAVGLVFGVRAMAPAPDAH